jgi:hypothetical protein
MVRIYKMSCRSINQREIVHIDKQSPQNSVNFFAARFMWAQPPSVWVLVVILAKANG